MGIAVFARRHGRFVVDREPFPCWLQGGMRLISFRSYALISIALTIAVVRSEEKAETRGERFAPDCVLGCVACSRLLLVVREFIY